MKKTLLAASIAALSAGFVAAPALAEVAGSAGVNLVQPTDSDLDTALTLEFDVNYTHESGAYGGFWFETYDFLEGDDFAEESYMEVYGGYAASLTEEFGYDVGALYGQPLDNDDEDYIWVYFGGSYTLNPETSMSAYLNYDIDSDVDFARLDLFAEYTGVEVVDLFAEYKINLEDTDDVWNNSLELGVGKEILPQHYATASFEFNTADSDYSAINFSYFYSF